jgi:hypothetical protein
MRKQWNIHQEEESLPRLLIFIVIFVYYMYFYTSYSKNHTLELKKIHY